jgi:penicillin-binding protein 1B
MPLRLRLPRPRHPLLVWGGLGAALAVCLAAVWLLWPFWRLSGQFATHLERQPSRLYGRSAALVPDKLLAPDDLSGELGDLGYREASAGTPLGPGQFRRAGGRLTVSLRRFPTPDGTGGGQLLEVSFDGRRISRLTLGGKAVERALLDPPLVASYYGDDLQERRPVRVDALPEELVWAVLAAEDDSFFHHTGISLSGVLRAAWVDLRGGGIRQGGSTLTQQLVKNLYLSPERTLGRKLREAVLALLLEARYDKREILQAYLNEIYLGASQGVSLVGVGAAARAYFGKPAAELDLAECATLAGMIQSPATYSPLAHPQAARARRDAVLQRMGELKLIPAARAEAARQQPLTVHPQPVVRRRAPYFADAAAREAAERFGAGALADAGYTLLSTLDAGDQEQAEAAVAAVLEALDGGKGKRRRDGAPLQAALVSVDPDDGDVLAYVGGRDYAASQYDRAGQARRQAGSAFKPVVYAAAFEDGVAAPSSLIEDEPLTVRLAGREWSPQNYDETFHGWVTVRTALEQSYNVATARLALQVGLGRIVTLAHRLGVTAPLEPVPALALGAFEVSPVEMATVYATFAAGGRRPAVHALTAVFDAKGRALPAAPLPPPEQAVSVETAYLVTSVLQGVLDRGTASAARGWGLEAPLAGKTGTSNGRRDNWFAGYSPGRASVVWVGYDDNGATRLSGSRAALPIWTRFTARVRPAAGFATFPQPAGIVTAVVDPESGELATDACPQAITEVFRAGFVPDRLCHLHGGGWAEPLPQPPGVEAPEDDRSHPFRRWLRRVFGRGVR